MGRSGADLELRSLIARAGFDPDDPLVYKFGAVLLEQLADEYNVISAQNYTIYEFVNFITGADEPATTLLETWIRSLEGIGSGSAPVESVNDKTGIVVLNATDVGASPVGHTHTPESIGAAATTHTHDAADVTDLLDVAEAKVDRTGATVGQVPILQLDGSLLFGTVSGGGGSGAVDSVNGRTGSVVLSKTDVGLANVDNTSDANKPISTATQTALNAKAAAADLTAHTSNTSNPHSTTKAQVNLGNVDNTSDLDKPISTATQTALNGKSDVGHIHDSRYYTETEVDDALMGKSDTSHIHDDRYYTETETNTLLSGKSNTTHTHAISDVSGLQAALDNAGGSPVVETKTISYVITGDNTWTAKQPTVVRYNQTLTYYDEKLYQLGGSNASQVTPSLYVYDIASNTWTSKASMANNKTGHSTIAVNNKLYVFGGNTTMTTNPTSDLNIYDIATNSWTYNSLYVRYTPALVAVGSVIWIFGGGSTSTAATGLLSSYNTTTTTATSKASASTTPTLTNPSGALLSNGEMIFITQASNGGCQIYNPTNDTWRSGPALGIALGATTRTHFSPRMSDGLYRVIVDGERHFTYNETTNTFTAAEDTTALSVTPAFAFDGNWKLYRSGGMVSGTPVGDLYSYEIQRNAVQPISVQTPGLVSSLTSGLDLRNANTGKSGTIVAAGSGHSIYPTGAAVDSTTATSIDVLTIS